MVILSFHWGNYIVHFGETWNEEIGATKINDTLCRQLSIGTLASVVPAVALISRLGMMKMKS